MSAAEQAGHERASHLRIVEPGEELPACDLLAEKIVAAAVVENLAAADESAARITEVCEIVAPEDFFDRAYRSMFRAALAIHERGERPTPNAVTAELERLGRFDTAARELFYEILGTAPEERDITARAARIRELARRRTLSQTLAEAAARLRSRDGGDFDELARKAAAAAEELANDASPKQTPTRAEVARETFALAIEQPPRIATGIRGFDEITQGGIVIGETTWLGATPGVGKSALAGFLAVRIAEAGEPVLVVSREMEPARFLERMACERASIPLNELRAPGGLRASLRDRYLHAIEELAGLPLKIVGSLKTPLGGTVASVRAELNKATKEIGRPRMVVIDYVQACHIDKGKHSPHYSDQISEYAKGLAELAQRGKLAVLGIIQLKADGSPRLCTALMQHADNEWHLRRVKRERAKWAAARDDEAHIETVSLWVEKARFCQGQVDTLLRFDKSIQRFEDGNQ